NSPPPASPCRTPPHSRPRGSATIPRPQRRSRPCSTRSTTACSWSAWTTSASVRISTASAASWQTACARWPTSPTWWPACRRVDIPTRISARSSGGTCCASGGTWKPAPSRADRARPAALGRLPASGGLGLLQRGAQRLPGQRPPDQPFGRQPRAAAPHVDPVQALAAGAQAPLVVLGAAEEVEQFPARIDPVLDERMQGGDAGAVVTRQRAVVESRGVVVAPPAPLQGEQVADEQIARCHPDQLDQAAADAIGDQFAMEGTEVGAGERTGGAFALPAPLMQLPQGAQPLQRELRAVGDLHPQRALRRIRAAHLRQVGTGLLGQVVDIAPPRSTDRRHVDGVRGARAYRVRTQSVRQRRVDLAAVPGGRHLDPPPAPA